MKRPGKTVLVLLAIAAVFIAIAIVTLPHLLKLDQIRKDVEAMATEALNRDVTVSRIRLSVFTGPEIILEDVSIAGSEDFGPEPVIQTSSIHMETGLSGLLDGSLQIRGVSLVHPSIRFVRNPDGTWNFQDSIYPVAGKLLSMAASNQDSLKSMAQGFTPALSVNNINIQHGEIILVDRSGKILDSDLTITGVEGKFTNLTPGMPGKFVARVKLFEDTPEITIDGSLGPMDGMENLQLIPMNVTVKAPNVTIRELPVPMKDIPLVLSGSFLANQTLKGTFGEGFHFQQDLAYKDFKVKTEKGFTLAENLSGTLIQSGRFLPVNRTVHIDALELEAGNARLSATGMARHHGVLPYLEIGFKSSDPDLGSLIKHFPDMEKRLKVQGDITAEGSLKGVPGEDLTADIVVRSNFIEADRGPSLLENTSTPSAPSDEDSDFTDLLPPSLPFTVSARISVPRGRFEWVTFTELTAGARLKDRWVSLDRMKFNAFDGVVEGSAWFNMRQLPATYGNDIKIRGMEIDEFLTSFAGLEGVMYGTASLGLFVSGRGKNMDQFKENTTGLGRFQISTGRYTPVNFLKEALDAASIPTDGLHSDETEFDSMDSSVAIRGGKVDFTSLDCISKDWNLEGSGIIGMDQSLSLKYRMTLSDSKASAIGTDKLKALPKDKRGSPQIPFRLSGTFTSPVFSIIPQDTGQTAER